MEKLWKRIVIGGLIIIVIKLIFMFIQYSMDQSNLKARQDRDNLDRAIKERIQELQNRKY